MKTYNKASDWMALLIDLAEANGIYLPSVKLYEILYNANEIMKKATGMPLFKEKPVIHSHWVSYDSVQNALHGVVGPCPVTIYEPNNLKVYLIQVNALRKALKLPVINASFEFEAPKG